MTDTRYGNNFFIKPVRGRSFDIFIELPHSVVIQLKILNLDKIDLKIYYIMILGILLCQVETQGY